MLQRTSSNSFAFLLAAVACLFFISSDYSTCAPDSGWYTNDGNMWRSRYFQDGSPLGNYQTSGIGWKILSRSLVMDPLSKNLYGMATNLANQRDYLISIPSMSGIITPISQFPPAEEGEWVKDIAPLFQQEGSYYFTVRRHPLSNKDSILRSSVITGQHFSFTENTMYRPILGMILVKSGRNGLVIVHDSMIQCFNTDTGDSIWRNYRDGLLDGVKMFVEEDNLLVFGKEYGYQISVSSGSLLGSAHDSFNVEGKQEFFALSYMGQNTIISTIKKAVEGYSVINYNARRLYDIVGKTTVLLKDQFGVPIDLNNCTNILSTSVTFNFMCKGRNSPPFIYGYALKNGYHLIKSYEINLNHVTGMNAKSCSNQIALVDEDKFAVVCDIGMVVFRVGDETVSPRVEFRIPINVDSQVFGTFGKLSVASFDGNGSFVQSLKTK